MKGTIFKKRLLMERLTYVRLHIAAELSCQAIFRIAIVKQSSWCQAHFCFVSIYGVEGPIIRFSDYREFPGIALGEDLARNIDYNKRKPRLGNFHLVRFDIRQLRQPRSIFPGKVQKRGRKGVQNENDL